MPLHEDTDYGVTPEQPYFRFRALFWDEDAVLVVTDDDDQFCMIERTFEVVTFNGTKLHGLVPRALADELIAKQHQDFMAYTLFDDIVEEGQFTPKLVWEWVPFK